MRVIESQMHSALKRLNFTPNTQGSPAVAVSASVTNSYNYIITYYIYHHTGNNWVLTTNLKVSCFDSIKKKTRKNPAWLMAVKHL